MFNEKPGQINPLDVKVKEFQMAMNKYHRILFYKKAGNVISLLVISLQLFTAFNFYKINEAINSLNLIFPMIFAWILTDFINGLIHMYMDNNTRYSSICGPFIAAFHLHHLSPRYTDKHPLKIYFYESGTKFWLVVYLCLLGLVQSVLSLPVGLNFCMVCIGIFSSLAEVSHFWCHNSKNKNAFINFYKKTEYFCPQNTTWFTMLLIIRIMLF